MSSKSVILKFSAANIFSDLIHDRINLRGNSELHFYPTIENNFDKINRFGINGLMFVRSSLCQPT